MWGYLFTFLFSHKGTLEPSRVLDSQLFEDSSKVQQGIVRAEVVMEGRMERWGDLETCFSELLDYVKIYLHNVFIIHKHTQIPYLS